MALDEAGRGIVREIGERHGFSEAAALAIAEALLAGGGRQAQFGHPELGGMGQWSQGGMLMIGDMFNDRLKGRVAGLAEDLSAAVTQGRIAPAARAGGGGQAKAGGDWWPDGLGTPSSTGSQNGRRYAVFPEARRLAVETDGRIRLFDTGDHRIGGASQAQGGGTALDFSSQHGPVALETLQEVGSEGEPSKTHTQAKAGAASAPAGGGDVYETIRRLAELKDQGHLTEDEFAAKKSELLGRL